MKIFTGIGSRETPAVTCALMVAIAYRLAVAGWTLRSGAADGADSAFEEGCDQGRGKKEIFLPWKGFNNCTSTLFKSTQNAYELAATLHPAWERLGEGPRKLHSRNCYQVLGLTLGVPTEAVICWTKDGCETRKQRSNLTGGTGTAIVLANDRGIPVFNLKNDDSRVRLHAWLASQGIDVAGLNLLPEPKRTQSSLF